MTDATNTQKCETTTCTPERARAGRTYRPNVDIIEQKDELLLIADVPGATADKIDIEYNNGALTLLAPVAPRFTDDTAFVVREYGVGDFERTFQIGEGIDAGRISAEFTNGVLTVHLPKVERLQARKITVKS